MTNESAASSRPRVLGRWARDVGRRHRRQQQAGHGQTPWAAVGLFVLPSLLVYLLFMVVPFLGTLRLSLTDWDGFSPVIDFVGLANYAALVQDDLFLGALRNNIIWAIVGTAAPMVIGFPLAVILWSGARWRSVFRAVYFLPIILPVVVIGLIWGWIYNPLFGVLNTMLDAIGQGHLARGWLGRPDTALPAVLVAAIWAQVGFVVVMLLAGLQGIDMNLVDAAKVDGANALQRARHVLLPGIAPVFTFVLTVTLVGAFSVFDIVYVMTGGGPGTATETMALYSYEAAFERNQAGYGAAISMVIATTSLILALILLRARERGRARL